MNYLYMDLIRLLILNKSTLSKMKEKSKVFTKNKTKAQNLVKHVSENQPLLKAANVLSNPKNLNSKLRQTKTPHYSIIKLRWKSREPFHFNNSLSDPIKPKATITVLKFLSLQIWFQNTSLSMKMN